MITVYMDATKSKYGILAVIEKENTPISYRSIASETLDNSNIILSTLLAFESALYYFGKPDEFGCQKAVIQTPLYSLLGLPLKYFMQVEGYEKIIERIFNLQSQGYKIEIKETHDSEFNNYSKLAHELASGEILPEEMRMVLMA